MADLVIRGGKIIDPKNHFLASQIFFHRRRKSYRDLELFLDINKARIECRGKIVIPGIIDMHTHMRTLFGHPHAQRMVALAGVCTAF